MSVADAAAPAGDLSDKLVLHGISREALVGADLDRLARAGGGALGAVHAHMNHAKHSRFELASGLSYSVDLDSPLRKEYLRPNMNGQSMAALVEAPLEAPLGADAGDASDFTDAFFTRRADAFSGMLEMHMAAAGAATIDAETGDDRTTWTPTSGVGSKIACYAVPAPPDAEHDGDSYVLVVATNETAAGTAAYEHACACVDAGATVRQYLDNARTHQLRLLAERNAARLLAAVAVAAGVRITWTNDMYASEPSQNDAKPLLAIPQVHCEFNVIKKRNIGGKDVAVVYDDTIDAYGARGGLLFDVDPHLGARLVPGDGPGRAQFYSEATLHAFPLAIGRGKTDAAVARAARAVGARISWPKKAEGAAHPALAPGAWRAFSRADAATLAALSNDAVPIALRPVVVHYTTPREA